MKNINGLKLGAIFSYLSLFSNMIIQILYTPIMLQLLGQAEYGLYTLAYSVVGYLGVLEFGIGNAVVRYISKYRAKDDKEGEYNLNAMFIIIYSLIAFIVSISGYIVVKNSDLLFSNTLSIKELENMKILMGLMVFNLAISLPFSVFSSIMSAYEKFTIQKIIAILRSVLNPMIMLPLLLMGYKSVGMIMATTIINIVFIIVNVYYCVKVLKIKVKFNKLDFSLAKEIFKYSYYIFLGLIVDKIYWSTDQLILGSVVSSSAVAIYAIGSSLNVYYLSFSTAISGVFLPRVTNMITNNASNKELSDLFIKIGRIQYIILSYILCGFILVGDEFVEMWAGIDYKNAYYIALAVMIPITIPSIQNLGLSILQAKNMHKFRSNLYIVIAIINVVISIPFAYKYGGFGCALASGICFFIGNGIIMNVYYYKKVKLDIIRFWKNILSLSITPITSTFIVYLIDKNIDLSNIQTILINGVLLTIVYIVLSIKISINDYEKSLIDKPIKIIKSKFTKVGV